MTRRVITTLVSAPTVTAPAPAPVVDNEVARMAAVAEMNAVERQRIVEQLAREEAARQIQAYTPEGLFGIDAGMQPQAYR